MSAAVSNDIRLWVKVALFLSSISLLFIAVSIGCGWKFYVSVCRLDGPVVWQGWYSWFFVFLLLGVGFGFAFPQYLISQIKGRNSADVFIKTAKDQSYEAIGQAVLYLSLFIAHDCSSERYIWLFIFIVSVTLIYCQTNSFTLNPMLIIWGYRFYDTDVQYDHSEAPQRFLIMSKTEIREGQWLRINRWSNKGVAINEEEAI